MAWQTPSAARPNRVAVGPAITTGLVAKTYMRIYVQTNEYLNRIRLIVSPTKGKGI